MAHTDDELLDMLEILIELPTEKRKQLVYLIEGNRVSSARGAIQHNQALLDLMVTRA
jgi:hypothetical protein